MLDVRGIATIQTADDITKLMSAIGDGDAAAYDDAVSLLYDELHKLAHIQLAKRDTDNALQTTALVNEAYLKLKHGAYKPVDRGHFLAIAATAMRHIIIDYAKSRLAAKRGAGAVHIELDANTGQIDAEAEQLLQINDALSRLREKHERLARIFECKFFAGFDDDETAKAINLSKRTVQRDWIKARAFLQEELTPSS
ncbi:ECF-type sigma factor [Hyphococcus luteus]|nr:ECF-type sigma factor [Marinicaulis flavus]